MTNYITEKDFINVKKQRRTLLIVYIAVSAVFLAVSIYFFVLYRGLTYKSPEGIKYLIIECAITAVFIIFSFPYLSVVFGRVDKFYKLLVTVKQGVRENWEAEFLRYDEELQINGGVDFKSLVFNEWNKYKKEFYERKVLVFYERPFPKLQPNSKVRFVTQSNVLVQYETINEGVFYESNNDGNRQG